MKNILVTGATGPQGRPVAEQLLAAGFRVRALVRDTDRATALADMGVELVQGDLDDPASVASAMTGQNGVFMLISFFTGTLDQARTLIAAAAEHHVDRIVWNVAGRVPAKDTGNPAVDKWRPILAALESSGVPFTALQPTVYMENFMIPAIAQEVAEKSVLAYPMPEDARCQWISHQDTAAYTVAALRTGHRDNQVIDVCGPETLSGKELAERFGRALGRRISFRPMPPTEFAGIISFGGNEEAIVRHYQHIFDHPEIMFANVDHAASLAILPIKPMSLEQFVRHYREVFDSSAPR